MTENQIAGPAWDLSCEYESVTSQELKADLDRLSELLREAETRNANFQANSAVGSAQTLTKLREQASTLLANVGTYAHCLLSVDSQLEDAQKLNGELQNFYKRFGDVFEPLSQFLDDADDDTIMEYLADADIAPNAFLVLRSRERAHENLSLAEESLVNGLSQDGIHAWGKLYDQLAGSLTCQVVVGNEEQEMGIAQANALMSSADDHQRRAAWLAINEAWSAHDESTSASDAFDPRDDSSNWEEVGPGKAGVVTFGASGAGVGGAATFMGDDGGAGGDFDDGFEEDDAAVSWQ